MSVSTREIEVWRPGRVAHESAVDVLREQVRLLPITPGHRGHVVNGAVGRFETIESMGFKTSVMERGNPDKWQAFVIVRSVGHVLTVGDVKIELTEGDFVVMDATVPHFLRGVSGRKATLLVATCVCGNPRRPSRAAVEKAFLKTAR